MLRFLLFATWIAAAAAQTADQSIAATASRTVPVPAESAVLELRATTPAATTLAQLLEALAGTGLKEEHLSGVSANGFVVSAGPQFQGQRGDFTYSFRLTAGAAAFRDLIARLDEARQKLGENVRQLDYNLYLTASAAAVQAAREASLPLLFEEAKAKAESLARAAGVRLGPVLSVTEAGGDSFGDPRGPQVTFSLFVRFGRQ